MTSKYYPELFYGHLYHVYNRANGSDLMFYSHRNYIYFIEQYNKYLSGCLDTFCFCLMPNHFHLLVRPKDVNPGVIKEQFRKFFISYTMSINNEQKRNGSLFQRGFKRKIIEDEKYFYTAVYYIHANPIHHGITDTVKDYRYSSYNLLKSDKFTNLSKNELLEWFGDKTNFIKYHEENKKIYYDEDFILEE